jgi:putative transposase
MSWTEITRPQYRRDELRFASDLRDGEWLMLSPLLCRPCHLGRPRKVDMREVVNAVLYVLRTGCQWRALPKRFPPRSTVQYYFYLWRDQRMWRRINLVFVRRARQHLGRSPVPSVGIIDSQSVKTTESGGPRGFDAAKRLKGRKRHIVTDTQGFLLAVHVHTANVQDVHGAVPLLRSLRASFPKLRYIFADRVYRGSQLRTAIAKFGRWKIEIVSRTERNGTFRPQRKRWVVERSFAWFGRDRRLARDFERTIASEEAWFLLSSIRFLIRRLARA